MGCLKIGEPSKRVAFMAGFALKHASKEKTRLNPQGCWVLELSDARLRVLIHPHVVLVGMDPAPKSLLGLQNNLAFFLGANGDVPF